MRVGEGTLAGGESVVGSYDNISEAEREEPMKLELYVTYLYHIIGLQPVIMHLGCVFHLTYLLLITTPLLPLRAIT